MKNYIGRDTSWEVAMKIAKIKFMVKDNFEPGDCISCPLAVDLDEGEFRCSLDYRNCDCPIQLDNYGYAMDEEDITD